MDQVENQVIGGPSAASNLYVVGTRYLPIVGADPPARTPTVSDARP